LINHGASVHAADWSRNQPLHCAAEFDAAELIPLFFGAGANLNAVRVDGMTPLLVAVSSGNKASVEALLRLRTRIIYEPSVRIFTGIDITLRDGMNRSALHWAVMSDRKSLVRRFLHPAEGIDIDGADLALCRPLQMAIMKDKKQSIVALLVAHGAKVTVNDINNVIESSNVERLKLLSVLLDEIPRRAMSEPLRRALMKRNLKATLMLLQFGAFLTDQQLMSLWENPFRVRGRQRQMQQQIHQQMQQQQQQQQQMQMQQMQMQQQQMQMQMPHPRHQRHLLHPLQAMWQHPMQLMPIQAVPPPMPARFQPPDLSDDEVVLGLLISNGAVVFSQGATEPESGNFIGLPAPTQPTAPLPMLETLMNSPVRRIRMRE
jgi:hypothetical protein